MLCRLFFCLVSWTYQSYVNLPWSILIKLVWHVWKRSTRTKQYCTNSSSTWLYMLPQDCSGFHRGRYIICWQLPFKNEFTTLAKKCRYSWREVSCSRARASEGSLVRACMLLNQFRNPRHPMAMKCWSRVTFRLLTDNLMIY